MPDTAKEAAAIARKYAVKNAFDYGKARVDSVLNKIFSELPEAGGLGVKTVRGIAKEAVDQVNAMPRDAIEKEVASYTYVEPKQRVGLPELEWAEGGVSVNTRFAPNPSGFLHIGHAKVAILCDEYSKRYSGKFYVRFEDTDPKTKRPLLEAYSSIVEDLKWLGCSIYKVIKQSERLDIYYSYAKKLIEDGGAYVCLCEKEEMQGNRNKGKPCGHREASPETNMQNWEKMMTTLKEGAAVLRLKTDMSHPNTSVRDWVMFRIIDMEHPLHGNKYRVWPLYNFACVIDDHGLEINLVIRGKEHEINSVKQEYLYRALGWTNLPHTIEVGILKVKGAMAHKSDIIKAIREGGLTGWDDPRAPTVAGFRNLGFQAAAIREYVVSSGIGKNDSYLDMKKLESIGRGKK